MLVTAASDAEHPDITNEGMFYEGQLVRVAVQKFVDGTGLAGDLAVVVEHEQTGDHANLLNLWFSAETLRCCTDHCR